MQLGCVIGEATHLVAWHGSCADQQGHAPRDRDADSEAGILVSMDTPVRAIRVHRGMRTVVGPKSRTSVVQGEGASDPSGWVANFGGFLHERSRLASDHVQGIGKQVVRISRFTLRLGQAATQTGSESSGTSGCSDKVPLNPYGVFTRHRDLNSILQPPGKGAWEQPTSAQARRQCLKVNTFGTHFGGQPLKHWEIVRTPPKTMRE